MKIELKNRAEYDLGEFIADLYIEGILAGVARSEAGNVSYESVSDRGQELIARAEEYCKSLPPIEDPDIVEDGKPVAFSQTLETVIIELEQQISRQSFLQKMDRIVQKDQEHHIIVVNRQHPLYELLPLPSPVSKMLMSENGRRQLVRCLSDRILFEFKGDGLVLNRNIPEAVYRESGLKADQYALPLAKQAKRAKTTVKKGKPPGR